MEIQLSDVTMHPKGTPAPASSVEARVFEERVDLSNNMTGWQMIGVGIRRLVLARGELDRLEGPQDTPRGGPAIPICRLSATTPAGRESLFTEKGPDPCLAHAPGGRRGPVPRALVSGRVVCGSCRSSSSVA